MSSEQWSDETLTQLSTGARVRSLDALRGIAILLVLMHHDFGFAHPKGMFGRVNTFFAVFGWTGVDLFFVLSGFLIGGLIFREVKKTGTLNVKRFLFRRAFKIWPGYLALLLYASYREVRHGSSVHHLVTTYWPNLLHIQNYTRNLREPTWSLAVEEHFYLFLPALVFLLALRGRSSVERLFVPVASLLIGFTALFRTLHGLVTPYSEETHYYPTHIRLDALLFGVLLAHIATFSPVAWRWLARRGPALLILAFILIAPMTQISRRNLFGHTAGYTLLYLCYGSLLIAALSLNTNSGFMSWHPIAATLKILAGVGYFSYAIYLWHWDLVLDPLSYYLQPLTRQLPQGVGWLTNIFVYLLSAAAVGVVMTYAIEKPSLVLREALFGSEHRTRRAPNAQDIPGGSEGPEFASIAAG